MGLFDRWKVLSEHCMVKNFLLTVPDGSEVYLDAEQADASWLVTEDVPASCDRYQIPTLIPGKSACDPSSGAGIRKYDAGCDYRKCRLYR